MFKLSNVAHNVNISLALHSRTVSMRVLALSLCNTHRLCALLHNIYNVQNVNLSVALHSELSVSMLAANIVQYPSYDKHICVLLLFISIVVQNVYLVLRTVWQ